MLACSEVKMVLLIVWCIYHWEVRASFTLRLLALGLLAKPRGVFPPVQMKWGVIKTFQWWFSKRQNPYLKTVGSWSSIQARHLGPWTCYAVTSAGFTSVSNEQTLNLIFRKWTKSQGCISGWEVKGECGLHNHCALCWHKMALWHAVKCSPSGCCSNTPTT